jgi:translation initiation factor IF-3
VTIMFRGREMAHADRGRDLLDRLAEDVIEIAKIDTQPKLDGRNMTMVLSPHRDAITRKPAQKKERPPRETDSPEEETAARPAKVTRAEGG